MTARSSSSEVAPAAAPECAEAGATTVEMVVLAPALMLLLFGFIQGGFFLYGRSVAMSAAEQGVAAARVQDGTSAMGNAAVVQFVRDAGGDRALRGVNPQTSFNGAGTMVKVIVTGYTPGLIPGFTRMRVTRTATGPVESFTQR